MNVLEAISSRRSIKEFTDSVPERQDIERLLEAACQAPNHRMTEPWRFYVLGPESRAGYGRALGLRKAKRIEEPGAAQAVVEKVAGVHRDLPCMVAVTIVVDENPEILEEDQASAWMAVQNLSLAAPSLGLGTHIMTGAVMNDPNAIAAMGVPESERVVAIVRIGEPASVPKGRGRRPGSEVTNWVD